MCLIVCLPQFHLASSLEILDWRTPISIGGSFFASSFKWLFWLVSAFQDVLLCQLSLWGGLLWSEFCGTQWYGLFDFLAWVLWGCPFFSLCRLSCYTWASLVGGFFIGGFSSCQLTGGHNSCFVLFAVVQVLVNKQYHQTNLQQQKEPPYHTSSVNCCWAKWIKVKRDYGCYKIWQREFEMTERGGMLLSGKREETWWEWG